MERFGEDLGIDAMIRKCKQICLPVALQECFSLPAIVLGNAHGRIDPSMDYKRATDGTMITRHIQTYRFGCMTTAQMMMMMMMMMDQWINGFSSIASPFATRRVRIKGGWRRHVKVTTRRRVDASTRRRVDASTRWRVDASTRRLVHPCIDASTCRVR